MEFTTTNSYGSYNSGRHVALPLRKRILNIYTSVYTEISRITVTVVVIFSG
jgi:hypothetical protein